MTTCGRCGDCCDPVWYAAGPADIRQMAARNRTEDLVFAARHWHATGEQREGLHAYTCDAFDAGTRLCTAHDDRPPICRGYPWYDEPPGSRDVVLPAGCTFIADVTIPVRPYADA